MTDQEKIDGLARLATDAVEKHRAKGCVPLLLVFASPEEGFEHAYTVCPTGLDAPALIQFLMDAYGSFRIQ